jgi:hypothetical protein
LASAYRVCIENWGRPSRLEPRLTRSTCKPGTRAGPHRLTQRRRPQTAQYGLARSGASRCGARGACGTLPLLLSLSRFFLYLGFIALQAAIDDPRRADKAGPILSPVGVLNVPII